MKYIVVSKVKQFCQERDKQVSKEFLYTLDVLVEHVLDVACSQFNGHRKRLNSFLIPQNIKNPFKKKKGGINRG